MTYFFRLENSKIESNGLEYFENIDGDKQIEFYTINIPKNDLLVILQNFKNNHLDAFLNNYTTVSFLIIILDKKSNKLIVVNDKFGTNEILIKIERGSINISDSIHYLVDSKNILDNIDYDSAYEALSFYSIMPPKTIFKNIHSVALSHYEIIDIESKRTEAILYWDLDALLNNKNKNYDNLVKQFRDIFTERTRFLAGDGTAIALSGGIDSGGILGIVNQAVHKDNILSITIGGHGEKTVDLTSSRDTIDRLGVRNIEVYPILEDIKKLVNFYKDLSCPILADTVLPYSILAEVAGKHGFNKLLFGFGAEMHLGNLKVCKIAYRLSVIEKLIPKILMNVLYNLIVNMRGYSENQKMFLLASSWSERFLFARGPHYIHDKKFYRKISENFFQELVERFKIIEKKKINLLDRLTQMYFFSWVSYMQLRDCNMLSKKYNVKVFSPYDTPEVLSVMYSTPNKFRKKNKWNKQLIRDMYKPYVSEKLYTGANRSMIIPYGKLLTGYYQPYYDYLKTSKIMQRLVDLDSYEKQHQFHPEPGLNLIRFLGMALWYDTNFNETNLNNFFEAIERVKELSPDHSC